MIIDTRSEEIFKKGSIPNAKNLTQADVMAEHAPKSLLEVKTACNSRTIDWDAF